MEETKEMIPDNSVQNLDSPLMVISKEDFFVNYQSSTSITNVDYKLMERFVVVLKVLSSELKIIIEK